MPAKRRVSKMRSVTVTPVDVAVPVGDQPRTKALDWLKQFATGARRLLLYQSFEEWHAFGPPAFQAEMRERISRGEKPWQ